jgi:hypothetical protein
MAPPTVSRHKKSSAARPEGKESWLLAGQYAPEFASAVCVSISALNGLRPGWDGYGAPAIDPGIIASAHRLIKALPENLAFRPRVVPMSTGNLQFEWHHGKKVLELEFESADTIRFLQWHPEQNVEEEDVFPVADTDRAVELIQWFMSGTCV